MAKIFRMKKDWLSIIGNGSIGFHVKHSEGDLFYEQINDKGKPNEYLTYVPFKGGYPMWERPDFKFVDEYLEFVENTDKQMGYYVDKEYTQAQVDKMINEKQNTNI